MRGEAQTKPIRLFKVAGLSHAQLTNLIAGIRPAAKAAMTVFESYPDLAVRVATEGVAQEEMSRLYHDLRQLLGPHLYAEGERSLEEVVGRLLLEQHKTLALAESCTGGYISHRVTRIAGSSAYYFGGAVTYSNEAKVLFLGVRPETLEAHGAVSRETALEMSGGIRVKTGVSIGLAVTGVAGPAGGSSEKPVGTVWISIDDGQCHEARRFQFSGEREKVIAGTSQAALDWLRRRLLTEAGGSMFKV
jgi:nicotinamide-nucleotide amidase